MTSASVKAATTPVAPDLGLAEGQDLWVFAYGSLMWNPGFPFVETAAATLRGYHRRFCVYSRNYRGTECAPGLVLGLDRGGACRGIAFRVAAPHVAPTLAYLWEREMLGGVYRPKLKPVHLAGGRTVEACCFLVDRAGPQYCGNLDPARAAEMIRTASGQRGSNRDYLVNTVRHLEAAGIHDRALHALAARVEALRAAAADPA